MSSIWVWIWVEDEFTGSCKTLNLVCRVGTAFLWSGSAGGCSCRGGYKRAAEEFQFKNAISIWEEFLVSSHNDWVSLMWTFELEKKVAHKSRGICLVYGCEGSSMLRKLKVIGCWSVVILSDLQTETITKQPSHFTVNSKDTQSCTHQLF